MVLRSRGAAPGTVSCMKPSLFPAMYGRARLHTSRVERLLEDQEGEPSGQDNQGNDPERSRGGCRSPPGFQVHTSTL